MWYINASLRGCHDGHYQCEGQVVRNSSSEHAREGRLTGWALRRSLLDNVQFNFIPSMKQSNEALDALRDGVVTMLWNGLFKATWALWLLSE